MHWDNKRSLPFFLDQPKELTAIGNKRVSCRLLPFERGVPVGLHEYGVIDNMSSPSLRRIFYTLSKLAVQAGFPLQTRQNVLHLPGGTMVCVIIPQSCKVMKLMMK